MDLIFDTPVPERLFAQLLWLKNAAPSPDTPDEITSFLDGTAAAPVQRTDAVKDAIRDALREGGFKPSGRSKPASEYLVRVASDGPLRKIYPLVDINNAVSLHSGIPISVVDLDKVAGTSLRIGIVRETSSYIFNLGGQSIDVTGLPCLIDGDGPCANAVKDAQRTKVHEATSSALMVFWGATSIRAHVETSVAWAQQLLEKAGWTVERAGIELDAERSPRAPLH